MRAVESMAALSMAALSMGGCSAAPGTAPSPLTTPSVPSSASVSPTAATSASPAHVRDVRDLIGDDERVVAKLGPDTAASVGPLDVSARTVHVYVVCSGPTDIRA